MFQRIVLKNGSKNMFIDGLRAILLVKCPLSTVNDCDLVGSQLAL